jgi:hypothetical protein
MAQGCEARRSQAAVINFSRVLLARGVIAEARFGPLVLNGLHDLVGSAPEHITKQESHDSDQQTRHSAVQARPIADHERLEHGDHSPPRCQQLELRYEQACYDACRCQGVVERGSQPEAFVVRRLAHGPVSAPRSCRFANISAAKPYRSMYDSKTLGRSLGFRDAALLA